MTARFHDHLADHPDDPALALARAQRSMLGSGDSRVWAAFVHQGRSITRP